MPSRIRSLIAQRDLSSLRKRHLQRIGMAFNSKCTIESAREKTMLCFIFNSKRDQYLHASNPLQSGIDE